MFDRKMLIDIDGVLKLGSKAAPGLSSFLNFLNMREIKFCVVSNTTLSTSADLKKFFQQNNITPDFPILTASEAALNYVKKRYTSAAVYCIDKIKDLFKDLITGEQPEVVVIGDLGKSWDYDILNDIFNKVKAGADLVAMQKNRFWSTPEEGLLLDAGPFVKAIEYAADKEAVVIGKPSKVYFDSALNLIDSSIDKPFIMIGDDIETDIGAAQNYGGTGILMYTGKTKYPLPEGFHIKPGYEAQDLQEAQNIINDLMKAG